MYAKVIVDITHEKLDKIFEYHIPAELEERLHAGVEVVVPFGKGNREIKGYVIGNKADFVCHVMKNFTRGKAGFGSKQVTEKFLHWLSEVQPERA